MEAMSVPSLFVGDKNANYNTATDTATARKLKKRELDRRAQRSARERTKTRIAYLEQLVESLQADGKNSEISRLSAELLQITSQRDALLGMLRSFEGTIRRHLEPTPGHQNQPSIGSHHHPASPAVDTAMGPLSVSWDVSAPGTSTRNPDALPGYDLGERPFSQPCHQAGPSVVPATEDIIVPRPQVPCDCTIDNPEIESAANTWRAANKALGKHTRLSAIQLATEDFTSQDTPIRVVLDGWDSVESAGKMSVSWRKLRKIDETCFSACGPTERLAILTMMHLLLTYHGQPTDERRNALPRWFWSRCVNYTQSFALWRR